jgi:hypothetical protein
MISIYNNSYIEGLQNNNNDIKITRFDFYLLKNKDINIIDSVYNYRDNLWYLIKVKTPKSVYSLHNKSDSSLCVAQDIYVIETENDRILFK